MTTIQRNVLSNVQSVIVIDAVCIDGDRNQLSSIKGQTLTEEERIGIMYYVTAVKSIVYSLRSTRETHDIVLFTIQKS